MAETMDSRHPNDVGNSFKWWFGLVEDRDDPLKTGRVRVRIYGVHDQDPKSLPTEALPWAQVIMPVTSGQKADIGTSPTGLIVGSMVLGFFMDAIEAQRPMVLGAVPGIPEWTYGADMKPDKDTGRFDEPDVSRLARNEDYIEPGNNGTRRIKQSHHEGFNETGRTRIPLALSNSNPISSSNNSLSYDQPVSTYKASYPRNHVREYEAGHVFEVDDTPGHARIHEYHKSGTYYQIDDSGDKQTRVVGNNYDVVFANNHMYIMKGHNITVAGDARIQVQGNRYTEIQGNDYLYVKGNRRIQVGDNENRSNVHSLIYGWHEEDIRVDHNRTIGNSSIYLVANTHDYTVTKGRARFKYGANVDIVTAGHHAANVAESLNLKVGKEMVQGIGKTFDLKTGGAWTTGVGGVWDTDVGGKADIKAGGDIAVEGGSDIHLNTAGKSNPGTAKDAKEAVVTIPPFVTDPGLAQTNNSIEKVVSLERLKLRKQPYKDGEIFIGGNKPDWPGSGGGGEIQSQEGNHTEKNMLQGDVTTVNLPTEITIPVSTPKITAKASHSETVGGSPIIEKEVTKWEDSKNNLAEAELHADSFMNLHKTGEDIGGSNIEGTGANSPSVIAKANDKGNLAKSLPSTQGLTMLQLQNRARRDADNAEDIDTGGFS